MAFSGCIDEREKKVHIWFWKGDESGSCSSHAVEQSLRAEIKEEWEPWVMNKIPRAWALNGNLEPEPQVSRLQPS